MALSYVVHIHSLVLSLRQARGSVLQSIVFAVCRRSHGEAVFRTAPNNEPTKVVLALNFCCTFDRRLVGGLRIFSQKMLRMQCECVSAFGGLYCTFQVWLHIKFRSCGNRKLSKNDLFMYVFVAQYGEDHFPPEKRRSARYFQSQGYPPPSDSTNTSFVS